MSEVQFFKDLDGDLGRVTPDKQTFIMQPSGKWVPYVVPDYTVISEAMAKQLSKGHDLYAAVQP